MRYFLLIFGICTLAVMGILGKRGAHFTKPPLYIFPDMEWQLKLRPQKANGFFTNGMTSQLSVPGTIARSTPLQTPGGPVFPYEDSPVNTGRLSGTTNFIENNPMPITTTMMERGRQRFDIYCSPCHGATGLGNGITQKIGAMAVVANLHEKRIVEMTDGELFDLITNGKSPAYLMPPYGPNISVQDRWAIVAYLRALQMARLGTLDDVPQEQRVRLGK
jgi:hypothetical protein